MRKQWIFRLLLTCLLTGAIDVLQAQDDCAHYTNQYEQLLKNKDLIAADSLVALLRVIQALRCPHDAALINRKKENLARLYRVTMTGNTGWATMSTKQNGYLVSINQEFAITGQLKNILEFDRIADDLYRIQDTLGGYWLFHKSGRFVTSTSYDSIWNFDENGYAGVQKDGKIGVIDKAGKEIVKPEQRSFTAGISNLRVDRKYGFINQQGKIIVPAIYQWTWNLENGSVLVCPDSSTYIFIDLATKETTTYNSVDFFEKDFSALIPRTAIVSIKWKFGIVDGKGRLLTDLQYDYISRFNFYNERLVVTKLYKQGVIDRFGKPIVPLQYVESHNRYSEGYLGVSENYNKWGFIDTTGKPITSFAYAGVSPFGEGLAGVSNGSLWGFIDNQNEVIIPFSYESAGTFSQGLCPVKVRGKWGYINKAQEMVIKAKYDWANSFHEFGQAMVTKDGRTFWIDKKGIEQKK
jgi:hypothetical protein